MEQFLLNTGVKGTNSPRRYLWTDAYAVSNLVRIYDQTHDKKYLIYIQDLINQVHKVLGSYHPKDNRKGYLSNEKHPTAKGLRIGKKYSENEHQDQWDTDGQYFHYDIKWIQSLLLASDTFKIIDIELSNNYLEMAIELGIGIFDHFQPIGSDIIHWKMSTDLSRPTVASMGQHDSLSGFLVYFESYLKNDRLEPFVNRLFNIIQFDPSRLATSDSLGVGGLLSDLAMTIKFIATQKKQLLFLFRQFFLRE
jgi:hypothetical protein